MTNEENNKEKREEQAIARNNRLARRRSKQTTTTTKDNVDDGDGGDGNGAGLDIHDEELNETLVEVPNEQLNKEQKEDNADDGDDDDDGNGGLDIRDEESNETLAEVSNEKSNEEQKEDNADDGDDDDGGDGGNWDDGIDDGGDGGDGGNWDDGNDDGDGGDTSPEKTTKGTTHTHTPYTVADERLEATSKRKRKIIVPLLIVAFIFVSIVCVIGWCCQWTGCPFLDNNPTKISEALPTKSSSHTPQELQRHHASFDNDADDRFDRHSTKDQVIVQDDNNNNNDVDDDDKHTGQTIAASLSAPYVIPTVTPSDELLDDGPASADQATESSSGAPPDLFYLTASETSVPPSAGETITASLSAPPTDSIHLTASETLPTPSSDDDREEDKVEAEGETEEEAKTVTHVKITSIPASSSTMHPHTVMSTVSTGSTTKVRFFNFAITPDVPTVSPTSSDSYPPTNSLKIAPPTTAPLPLSHTTAVEDECGLHFYKPILPDDGGGQVVANENNEGELDSESNDDSVKVSEQESKQSDDKSEEVDESEDGETEDQQTHELKSLSFLLDPQQQQQHCAPSVDKYPADHLSNTGNVEELEEKNEEDATTVVSSTAVTKPTTNLTAPSDELFNDGPITPGKMEAPLPQSFLEKVKSDLLQNATVDIHVYIHDNDQKIVALSLELAKAVDLRDRLLAEELLGGGPPVRTLLVNVTCDILQHKTVDIHVHIHDDDQKLVALSLKLAEEVDLSDGLYAEELLGDGPPASAVQTIDDLVILNAAALKLHERMQVELCSLSVERKPWRDEFFHDEFVLDEFDDATMGYGTTIFDFLSLHSRTIIILCYYGLTVLAFWTSLLSPRLAKKFPFFVIVYPFFALYLWRNWPRFSYWLILSLGWWVKYHYAFYIFCMSM